MMDGGIFHKLVALSSLPSSYFVCDTIPHCKYAQSLSIVCIHCAVILVCPPSLLSCSSHLASDSTTNQHYLSSAATAAHHRLIFSKYSTHPFFVAISLFHIALSCLMVADISIVSGDRQRVWH